MAEYQSLLGRAIGKGQSPSGMIKKKVRQKTSPPPNIKKIFYRRFFKLNTLPSF